MLRRFSRNTPIALRLGISVAVPVLGMIALAIAAISAPWSTATQLEHLQELALFAPRVSSLVHELQKERGMSAVFLNSGGQQLAAELPGQRHLTDERLAGVRAAATSRSLDAFPASVQDTINRGLSALGELDARRADISAKRLAAPDSNKYFTGVIALLLAVPREAVKSSGSPTVTTRLMAYYSYLMVKERAGQERANGAVGFAAGQFTPVQYRTYLTVLAEQQAFLAEFGTYATPDQQAFAHQTVSGPAAEEFERMRKVAVETGAGAPLGDITGSRWFGAATARIDLMKRVEDRLAGDLETFAETAAGDARRTLTIEGGAAIAAVILSLVLAIWLARGITRPILGMTETMRKLAHGDKSVEVPAKDNKDEIGAMGQAVQVFKDSMIETERLRDEQEAQKQRAAAERRQATLDMAAKFEDSVGGIVANVTSRANELQATAQSMAATAEQTTRQTTAVAAASEEATANVQTVASAAEQLTASVHEIGKQIGLSSQMIGDAVKQTGAANDRVQGLAASADKIGEVVRLISDIAGQTNLLALNATIEAARAGDAGKGFAVVASEVKALANQTARATEDIAAQVRAIQEATDASVESIHGVNQTIAKVNEAATSIASAIEQQAAATQEIARNVQQAAVGTQEVSSNIAGVSEAAQQTGAAAAQVLSSSGELSRNGDLLRQQVDTFLRDVRAA